MPEFHMQKGGEDGDRDSVRSPWGPGGKLWQVHRRSLNVFLGCIGGKEKSEWVESGVLGKLIEGGF
jgi:hypothetical protein